MYIHIRIHNRPLEFIYVHTEDDPDGAESVNYNANNNDNNNDHNDNCYYYCHYYYYYYY